MIRMFSPLGVTIAVQRSGPISPDQIRIAQAQTGFLLESKVPKYTFFYALRALAQQVHGAYPSE